MGINFLYFAYGSNMDIDHLNSLGVDIKKYTFGWINDYQLVINVPHNENKRLGYANIVPVKNKKVEGLLLKIPLEAEAILDEYEGFPELYRKVHIQIQTETNTYENVLVYIGNEKLTSKHDLELPEYQKTKFRNALQFLPKKMGENLLNLLRL